MGLAAHHTRSKTDGAPPGASGLVGFVADEKKNAPFIHQWDEAVLHQLHAAFVLNRKYRRQRLLLSIDIFILNTVITCRGYL